MDQKSEKSWDMDVEELKIKDELNKISERIDQIVKSLEIEDRADKVSQDKEKNEG